MDNGFLIQTRLNKYEKYRTGELMTLHAALEKLREIEKEDPSAELIRVVKEEPFH